MEAKLSATFLEAKGLNCGSGGGRAARSVRKGSLSDMVQTGIMSTVAMFRSDSTPQLDAIGRSRGHTSPALAQDQVQAAFVAETLARLDQVPPHTHRLIVVSSAIFVSDSASKARQNETGL